MKLTGYLLSFYLCALAISNARAAALRRQAEAKTINPDETRIIGGTEAKPGEYPFFVQWVGCGASLIHPDVILSAAHCNEITSNEVIVGNYLLDTAIGGGTRRRIVKRVQHPKYNSNSYVNDYLVMKLDLNVSQAPIPLNSKTDYPVSNQNLTIIGFGSTRYGGGLSKKLRKANVNYVTYATCSNEYKTYKPIDATTMLCAGITGGGKDTCQGDSGGPIFDDKGVLVGATSWGNQCALPNYPGVYSRISGAYSWIQEQVCKLSAHPPASCKTSTTKQTSAPVKRPTAKPSPAT